MTREEAQYLLEEAIYKFGMDEEDQDDLHEAVKILADPDND